jgi:hypothetical protein
VAAGEPVSLPEGAAAATVGCASLRWAPEPVAGAWRCVLVEAAATAPLAESEAGIAPDDPGASTVVAELARGCAVCRLGVAAGAEAAAAAI